MVEAGGVRAARHQRHLMMVAGIPGREDDVEAAHHAPVRLGEAEHPGVEIHHARQIHAMQPHMAEGELHGSGFLVVHLVLPIRPGAVEQAPDHGEFNTGLRWRATHPILPP